MFPNNAIPLWGVQRNVVIFYTWFWEELGHFGFLRMAVDSSQENNSYLYSSENIYSYKKIITFYSDMYHFTTLDSHTFSFYSWYLNRL